MERLDTRALAPNIDVTWQPERDDPPDGQGFWTRPQRNYNRFAD